MKPDKSPWKFILLIFLLAVVCIGAVELVFCSVKAPALYERITAPVRHAVHVAAETGKAAWAHTVTAVENTVEQGKDAVNRAWRSAKNAAARAAEQAKKAMEPPPEPEPPMPDTQQVVDESQLAPIPASARQLTCVVERDGVEYLTGGSWEITYFNQTEQPWGEQPYGTDHIAGYGCGPTSMAMAVKSLTGLDTDPARMAQWCVEQRHWAKYHGSYLSIVEDVAQNHGLRCQSVDMDTFDVDQLCQRLAAGELAVALMGPGHFTNSGHFILLRGVTLDGKVLVADPASRNRTLVTWEPELILQELSPSRHNGAPLWLITPDLGLTDTETETP